MARSDDFADADRLRRIVELCDGVAAAIGQSSLEEFAADDILCDAVAYRLAAIGEESKKLSAEFKGKHDLPWRQIAGMRDRLAHDYFGRVAEIVFATARNDLEPLRVVCVAALAPDRA